MSVRFSSVVSWSILLLAIGCSAPVGGRGGGSSGCIEGQQIECSCSNGAQGHQTCTADGKYDPCVCDGGPPADVVDGVADVADDAVETDGEVADDPDAEDPTDTAEDVEETVEDVVDDPGQEPDPGPDDPGPQPDTKPPEGCTDPVFAFPGSHVTTMTLPKDPAEFLCDANGDGVFDADDGDYNSFAITLSTGGVDLNGMLKDGIETNSHLLFFEHFGYAPSQEYTLNLLRGSAKETQSPCDAAGGEDCQWLIDPDKSIEPETCARTSSLANAKISASVMSAGPGKAVVPFPMGPLAWVDVTLTSVRVAGVASGEIDLEAGRICGVFGRAGFLTAITDLCSLDNTLTICGVQSILSSLLSCDNELCTVTLTFEANATAGMELAP